MIRLRGILASAAILCVGAGAFARTHRPKEAPVESSLGVPLTSRIPCDGATNPEDQINLVTTFSPGGWERSFRIETFESKYCKRGDLGWACIQPGHTLWKQEWSAASSAPSSAPSATGSFGLPSCDSWGSKEAPQVILTGWYKEGAGDSNLVWKQIAVKKVESRWETYQFTDPNGGTARVEIDRR
jgi:hypothetical protein